MPKTAAAQDVLGFWFDKSKPEQWYKKDPVFDETIRSRFEDTITAALSARLDSWADELDSCLALILVLDQFTRNIYRDTPKAFIGDEMALALSQQRAGLFEEICRGKVRGGRSASAKRSYM